MTNREVHIQEAEPRGDYSTQCLVRLSFVKCTPITASNHDQDRLYDFGYSIAAAMEASNPPSKASYAPL